MANSKYQQTILVIEDDNAYDGMLKMILSTRGYKVIVAKTGQDAISKSRLPVDLIIIDMMLGGMNGVEICHYIKQVEATRNVPIILISENSCPVNEKVQCFQLGADDLLCKPFENEELFARIFALLRRHHGEDHEAESQRFEQVKQLRQIIDRELVEPNFQPVYLVGSTCQLFGVEILSRPKVEGVLKNPEYLFQVALELGFYYELEIMVWRRALKMLEEIAPFPNIFLNCNPYIIENDNFIQIRDTFKDSSVVPQNVFFEITERSAICKYQLFYERLKQFREYGFKVAVDDVGCGYASLESIIETRPEVVKIDRHIISGLSSNEYKRSIVKFIVSFCNEHDIICVAEGVETACEFSLLKDLGVRAFQGYYFCKPTALSGISTIKQIFH